MKLIPFKFVQLRVKTQEKFHNTVLSTFLREIHFIVKLENLAITVPQLLIYCNKSVNGISTSFYITLLKIPQ